MITLDVEQGSPEWFAARLGIPTASNFSKIITARGAKGDQERQYMNELLAEWLSGEPEESFNGHYMQQGRELEAEARDYLQFRLSMDIKQVGLVYKDERKLVSASPDGIISEDEGCEIKCPKGSTLVEYAMQNKLPSIYVPQVQGGLWVTGFKRWKFLCYHKNITPMLITIERDEAYIKLLSNAVNDFIGRMLEKREKLFAMGYRPASEEAA